MGLAPGTAAAALSLPLLRTVRARHPGILLYLNENYGTTLSELIMNGRMDPVSYTHLTLPTILLV